MLKNNPIKEKIERDAEQAKRGLQRFGREFFEEDDDDLDRSEPNDTDASDDSETNGVEGSFEKNGFADDRITAFFTVLALVATLLCFLYTIVYLVTFPFRLIGRKKKAKSSDFDPLD